MIFKSRHGEPAIASAHGEDSGVVKWEKAGKGFVGHVSDERKAECEPGVTEMMLLHLVGGVRHWGILP